MAETLFNTASAIAAGDYIVEVEEGKRVTLLADGLGAGETVDIYYRIGGAFKQAYDGITKEAVKLTSDGTSIPANGPIVLSPVKAATAGAVTFDVSSWKNL